MAKKRTTLCYAGYAAAVTVFFLYRLFPSDAVLAVIQRAGNRLHPAMQIRIAALTPGAWLGMTLDDVEVRHRNHPLMAFKQLEMRPRLSCIVRGRLCFRLAGAVNGGTMAATLWIQREPSPQLFRWITQIHDIDLEKTAFFRQKTNRQISGLLSGSFRYPADDNTDAVEAVIGISDAAVQLKQPLLDIRPLNIEHIETVMRITGRTVTVSRCRLDGSDLSGAFSGTIALADRIENSRLDLKGRLVIGPALLSELENRVPELALEPALLRGGLPFALAGTLVQPVYTLN